MSENVDRILDLIDAGLQSSPEAGYGTDHQPDACARCQEHPPVEDGDLCDGCRTFLLGDSDSDPREERGHERRLLENAPTMARWFAERTIRAAEEARLRSRDVSFSSIEEQARRLQQVVDEATARRHRQAQEHGLTPENLDQLINLPPSPGEVVDREVHEVVLFRGGALHAHYRVRGVPSDVMLAAVPLTLDACVMEDSGSQTAHVLETDRFRRVGYVTTPMLSHFNVLKRHVYVWEGRS